LTHLDTRIRASEGLSTGTALDDVTLAGSAGTPLGIEGRSLIGELRIGIDVGGTKIAAGLVGTDGRIRYRASIPSPGRMGRQAIMSALGDITETLIERHAARAAVVGVGIGTSGVVERHSGRILCGSDNLAGWAGADVAGELAARVGLPVAVDNDGNTFALAEHHFGAGRGATDVLYVTVGTGVGGALILGNRLNRGSHHTAGEIGHIPAPGADNLPCNCGGTGHLEVVASGPAMTARYRNSDGGSAVADLLDVAHRAEHADELARAVLGQGATALGRILAGLVGVLDPQRVVVGGGVAQIGPPYWEPLRRAFRTELLSSVADVDIRPSALGTEAGVIGAATLLDEIDT
jgi:glucokinase